MKHPYAIVTTLNVGLKGNDGSVVRAFDVYAALAAYGYIVDRAVFLARSPEEEDTLVIETQNAVSVATLLSLCRSFKQDCVAVLVEYPFGHKEGCLVGPKAHEWGAFNPAFFVMIDGRRLSEAS